MISATSPNQEGVEGTDAEEVWMITEESAILVMSTSFIGKDLYPSLKGGTFYVCSLQATSRCAIRGYSEGDHAGRIVDAGYQGQGDGNDEVEDAGRHPSDEETPLLRGPRWGQVVRREESRETDCGVEQ